MALTHSPEPSDSLSRTARRTLLERAEASIRHGLVAGQPSTIDPFAYPAELQARRASFVTLNRNGNLRGCIGHLEAIQSLVQDVVENAFAAAFRDPRFPPLSEAEMTDLEIHISVLTPATPLEFSSEQDLVRRIRPGTDGLILEEGTRRGTFLPSVWESLPDPLSFLQQLKLKAGLPPDYWSDRLRVYRYQTESFSQNEL
jgi:AmmeMemoRadiSam system protein A